MTFSKKMMGFPSDLVSFSNQTKLPSKRHEKILSVTFFTGEIQVNVCKYILNGWGRVDEKEIGDEAKVKNMGKSVSYTLQGDLGMTTNYEFMYKIRL